MVATKSRRSSRSKSLNSSASAKKSRRTPKRELVDHSEHKKRENIRKVTNSNRVVQLTKQPKVKGKARVTTWTDDHEFVVTYNAQEGCDRCDRLSVQEMPSNATAKKSTVKRRRSSKSTPRRSSSKSTPRRSSSKLTPRRSSGKSTPRRRSTKSTPGRSTPARDPKTGRFVKTDNEAEESSSASSRSSSSSTRSASDTEEQSQD